MHHKLLLTCEHASNKIPKAYQASFPQSEKILASHRAWDIGAYEAYQALIKAFPHSLQQHAQWSRLLVELNRSIRHKHIFSEFTSKLPLEKKEELLKTYYEPYRKDVFNSVHKNLPILHIAVHSFTPCLNNHKRNVDIGLLYDPGRSFEKTFCHIWKQNINHLEPLYRVRKNYPYQGKTDGLTTSLRKVFSEADYIGIELELNQKFFDCDASTFLRVIRSSLKKTIQHF